MKKVILFTFFIFTSILYAQNDTVVINRSIYNRSYQLSDINIVFESKTDKDSLIIQGTYIEITNGFIHLKPNLYLRANNGLIRPTTTGTGVKATGSTTTKTQRSSPINDFQLAPNPVQDYIKLQSRKPIQFYMVYDVFGNEILRQEIEPQPIIELYVNALLSGYYTMKVIYSDQTTHTKRFIKE